MKWVGLLLLIGCATKHSMNVCPAPSEYEGLSTAKIYSNALKILQSGNETRALSFNVYGDNPKYTEGLIQNIRLAKTIYPGWKVFVYADKNTVPEDIIRRAREYGAEVFVDEKYNHPSARFFIANRDDIDRFIVRDSDSRIGYREAAAVAHWIKQDWAILHGMRDSTAHLDPLLGGMWGAQSQKFREKLKAKFGNESVAELYEKFMKGDSPVYGDDQRFLKDVVVEAIGEDAFLAHESFQCKAMKNSQGFPVPRSGVGAFIGQVKSI